MKKKYASIILVIMLIMTACGQKDALQTNSSEMVASAELQGSITESTEAAKESEKVSDEDLQGGLKPSATIASTETSKQTASLEATLESSEVSGSTETPEPTKTPASESASKPSATPEESAALESTTKPSEAPTPVQEQSEEPPSHTSCAWDGGSVTSQATCSSTGVKTYICTVCGNTRTESIPTTSHNYVTETTAATCTEAGKTKTYCSMCGNVQAETINGEAAGHDYQKRYWPEAPTCTHGGYYNVVCTKCGAHSGEEGTDGALPHTPVSTEISHGNCVTSSIIVTTCSVCGFEISREGRLEDEHDWVTGTYEEFNLETLEWETKTSTQCRRCGKIQ